MLYFTNRKISYPLAFAISGVLISAIAHNIIFQISSSVANFTSLFGVLIFFCAFAYYRVTLFPPLDNSTRVIFYLLTIYILSVLLRWGDVPITKVTVIRIVTDKYGVMGFLTPLIVFLGSKRINIQTIFRLSYISSLIGILFILFNFKEIFLTSHMSLLTGAWSDIRDDVNMGQIPGYFTLPSAFLLMSYKFAPPKYIKIGFIGLILSLATAILYGRRSYIAFHLIYLIFIGYMYFFTNKKSKWKKVFIILSVLILVSITAASFADLSAFNVLADRFNQNTRSGVEDYFFTDFKGKTLDWIFGRGINGTYYCPVLDGQSYRNVIETGYLQFILKGGLILLFLYVYILLKGAFLGFFRSKNTICKAMSLFLFANVIFLFSGNTLEFSFRQILTWCCVMLCYSTSFRNLSEQMLIINFKYKEIMQQLPALAIQKFNLEK